MLIPNISSNYFLIGCISDSSYILAVAPEFSSPQFILPQLWKFFEYSFCCYRFYHLQYVTRTILWLSTTENMYMILIKSNLIDYNVVPFTDSLHCLSDTFFNLRVQQNFTILHRSHKMVSYFIDSMGPLSQFHSNCIITPQTPSGGSRSPHSRDCGVFKVNKIAKRTEIQVKYTPAYGFPDNLLYREFGFSCSEEE